MRQSVMIGKGYSTHWIMRTLLFGACVLCIINETVKTNIYTESLNVTKSWRQPRSAMTDTGNYSPLSSPFWVDCTTECQVSCNSIIFVQSCFQQVSSSCLYEYNVYLQLQTSIFDKKIFSSEWLQTLSSIVTIRELEVSDISFGKIEYLQNNLFTDNQLSYLCTLTLYVPALKLLNNDSFTGLQNLNELTLVLEDITEVESGVLIPLQYTISILSISGVCSKNTEEIISKFTGSIYLPDLDIVNLNFNCLHYISKYMFEGLFAVESIYIMHCEISSIHPDAFRPMKRLKQIFLNDNSLTTLASSVIYYTYPIPKIYLKDNQWNCNCSLQWLNVWFRQNGYYENPKCYMPRKNRGKLFSDVEFCTSTTSTTITPSTEITRTSNTITMYPTTEHGYYSVASDSFAIQNISSYSFTESTSHIPSITNNFIYNETIDTTSDTTSTYFELDTTRDTKALTNITESSTVNEITTEYQTAQTNIISTFTATEFTSNSLPNNFSLKTTNIIDTSESTNTEGIDYSSSYLQSKETESTQNIFTNTDMYSIVTRNAFTQSDITYGKTSTATSESENMTNSELNTEITVTNISPSKMSFITETTEELTTDNTHSKFTSKEDSSTQSVTNDIYPSSTEMTKVSSENCTDFLSTNTDSKTSVTQSMLSTESSLVTETTDETNTKEATDLESTNIKTETTITSHTTVEYKTSFLTEITNEIISEETSDPETLNTDIETTVTQSNTDEYSLITKITAETNTNETTDFESTNIKTKTESSITQSVPDETTNGTYETSEVEYTDTVITETQSIPLNISTLTTEKFSSFKTGNPDIISTESSTTQIIVTEMTERMNSSYSTSSEATKRSTETSAMQEISDEGTSLMTTEQQMSTSEYDLKSSSLKTETYVTETLPYDENSLITEQVENSTLFNKPTSTIEGETEKTTYTPRITQTKSTAESTFQTRTTSITETTVHSTQLRTEATSTLSPIAILCETYDYDTKSKCDINIKEPTKPQNITEPTISMPSMNDNFYVVNECDSSKDDKENPIQLAIKVPDNSAMVWIRSDKIPSNEIHCLSGLHGIIFVNYLQYNSIYTFCILKGDDLLTSPFNCLAYKTQEMYDDQPWIMNRDKENVIYAVTGGIVAALFIGSICVFAFIRKYPKFIKGKRVLLVKHRIADVMIFPEKVPDQFLNEENLKKYNTDSVASRISSSAQSSTNTYVTINEPTPIEMIAYRFEQIIQRLNYVTNLNMHNHTEH